nr:hypothetical protein [Tanacetum cinerariifolium]GEY58576.1 hypothetical protein [Tanacetum cinerariifolium]
MGDENLIRTLGDYSKPSHEGYRNTIKLPVGNKVYGIDRAVGDKLRNKNTNESWEIIENLALYNHEGWGETKEFVKQVKAIATPQGILKTPDQRPHTEKMGRFKNAIFNQREEINGRMTEMFRLLKELTTNRTLEKVLIREEAKFTITKNVNSISLTKGKEEGCSKTEITPKNTEKPTETKTEIPVKEAEIKNEAKNRAGNKSIKTPENEEAVQAPGIAEDVLVKVAEHIYPMDFVIMDIKENEKRPFILGIPFLTTKNAIIKFDMGTITLSAHYDRELTSPRMGREDKTSSRKGDGV